MSLGSLALVLPVEDSGECNGTWGTDVVTVSAPTVEAPVHGPGMIRNESDSYHRRNSSVSLRCFLLSSQDLTLPLSRSRVT